MGKAATAPISSRTPVPLLPQSTIASGDCHALPRTIQVPGPVRSTEAPSAFTASAV